MYLYTDHHNHFFVTSESDIKRLGLPEIRLTKYEPGHWENLYPELASH